MRFPSLGDYPVVCLDTETTGLNWWQDRIYGISISVEDRDFYWDIRRTPEAVEWLREEIRRVRRLTAHNAKFDWHFCRKHGIIFPEDRVYCTMIRAALIDEHRMTYDLDSLGKDCVGVGKDTSIYAQLAEMFGGKPTKPAQIDNLQRAPVEMAARYAKQDTNTGLKLFHWQDQQIDIQDLGRVHDLERRLLPVIVRMEEGGVRVDVDRAEKAVREIDHRSIKLQKDLNKLAGFPVNPNPSGSIHKLFDPQRVKGEDGTEYWQANDGTVLQATDAGKASLDADALRKLKHPAAPMILNLRKLYKARDTFLKGHVLSNHHDGYIHANINQTKSEGDVGTGTGRLSINGPALQQIPKRDKEMAAIVRAIFVPDPGEEWVCNDWAQMDFRVFAHYVNDPDILKMYRDDPDTDFHSLTAGMTGLPRSPRFAGDPNAKQINLGLVFGMGQGRLAEEMGLPYTIEPNGKKGGTWLKPGPEAEEVFALYHGSIPGVKDLLRDASSVAKSRGHVKTIMGRRIRFPRGMFVHKAGGLIFQGTAADCLKVKLIELDDYIQSEGRDEARLLLNVHDEFDTSVAAHRKDIRDGINRIVTAFGPDDAISLRVPVRTDQGRGPDWWEASK